MISTRKFVTALAATAAIGLALAGCAVADPEPTEPGGPPATSAAPDPEAPGGDAAGDPVALPYTAELDGRRLTIEDLGSTTLAFGEPDAGNEVIYLEVTVENVAAETWRSNVAQFFLVGGGGELYGPSFASEAGDLIPDADLAVGQSATGFIPFEVPEGESPLTLEYAVDLSAGRTIDVRLR